jgi:pimeloyl-ACP methyl ester carboxylesterase
MFSGSESAIQISSQGTSKTTVLIAHCSVKFSRYMARSLGPDHSVVHIPSHRTEGTPVPFDRSVSDLASEAISHLKQTNKTGPFVLCGYSAGCPIAMEMARQLGQEKTLGMILLDPPFKMVGAEPELQPLYFRSYKRLRYIIKGWKRRFKARRVVPEIKLSNLKLKKRGSGVSKLPTNWRSVIFACLALIPRHTCFCHAATPL